MATPAAGAPATEAPPSQAQVPGLRGVLRKEDGKPKPGARPLRPPHLLPLLLAAMWP